MVVAPSDLITGDQDGVVVVKAEQATGLPGRCRDRMALKKGYLDRILLGEAPRQIFGLPAR